MMFTAICFILFVMVFFKLIGLALKVGWGIFKIAMFLVFFPIIVPIMIFCGFAALALPIILIAGIVGIVGLAAHAA